MRVNGFKIKRVVKEGLLMQMETFTKVFGVTIRLTALGHISIIMGLGMWVPGRMTSNMEKAMKVGQMDHIMKVNTRMVKNTVEASWFFLMDLHTRDYSITMIFTEQVILKFY